MKTTANETINNNRENFFAFLRSHTVQIPAMPWSDWRVVADQPFGQIQGLPTSHGRLVATNGVLCYLEQGSGLFLGHLDSFVKDKRPAAQPKKEQRKTDPFWLQLKAICGI